MGKTDQQQLESRIKQFVHYNALLRETTAKYEKEFFKKAGNIGAAQLRVILILGRRQPCTMSTLAKATGLTHGNMTQAIDRLLKKKLVKRAHFAQDRRVVFVEFTAAGAKLYKINEDHVSEVAHSFYAKLTEQEQIDMLGIMKKLVN